MEKFAIFLTIFLALVLTNCVNIPSVVIGSIYQDDASDVCSSGLVSFSLPVWLIAGGATGIAASIVSTVIALCSSIYGDDDCLYIVNYVLKVLGVLFVTAWWCVGVTIIAGSDDDCKGDYRRVWDITVANLVFQGFTVLTLVRYLLK